MVGGGEDGEVVGVLDRAGDVDVGCGALLVLLQASDLGAGQEGKKIRRVPLGSHGAEYRGIKMLDSESSKSLTVCDDMNGPLPVETTEAAEIRGRGRRVLRGIRGWLLRRILEHQEALSPKETMPGNESDCPT